MAKNGNGNQIMVFDTEIIGKAAPVFLVGTKNITTRERRAFWFHKRGHMDALADMLCDSRYTWVGFNSESFDRPLISIALSGNYSSIGIKDLATTIVEERLKSWQTYRQFGLEFIEYDHIDLFDVAPGVMTSLKIYMGRMGCPKLVDLPFHYDTDLTPKQMDVLESYCLNDLDGTEALYNNLGEELNLRHELSETYGLDLRSKSDAQMAEAVIKKQVGLNNGDKFVPSFIRYKAPDFIKTDSKVIQEQIANVNEFEFRIHLASGAIANDEYVNAEGKIVSVPAPFMADPLKLGFGSYQMGVGGLHSTHDQQMYLEASEDMLISDFDVTGYYPKIMLRAGFVPRMHGDKGYKFFMTYRTFFDNRVEAKRKIAACKTELRGLTARTPEYRRCMKEIEKNTKIAKSLKVLLNGTFGKLGNLYCSFYSPDLLLGVTVTGQLHLLCLIHELEKIRGVKVRSANTDGLVVTYSPKVRERVLGVFKKSSKQTSFEYEETRYVKYAAKDVNNYIAIDLNGDIKSKGLYAETGLMKNPTMEVCVKMVKTYMLLGTRPEDSIKLFKDPKDFVAIRYVKGGGVQFDKFIMVDDWVEVEPGQWRRPKWPAIKASVKRKSRPGPVEEGVDGTPCGRVARWYMTTRIMPPIVYAGSGNKVPKTEGARLCMTLPDSLPVDLDVNWYVKEAHSIMQDIGLVF